MAELRDWLGLVHCRGIGPRTVYKLLQAFDSPEALLRASNGELSRAGLSSKVITALRSVNESAIDADLHWCDESDDRHIVPLYAKQYPAMLRQIADPPLVLYVRGDIDVLHTPQVAIVGSRKPSTSAATHANNMARQLCHYGLTICSGLAVGVDASAHRGALQADGLTVAVTATGLDRVYPAAHQQLAQEITVSGAIVSEFPVGTLPKPAYFPRRNRIISGLCYGTLVVEAALKSGTLTTAAHATEQSREVFAIPGNIDNPQSRGCHALIRNGATLVESVEDILTQIAPLLPAAATLESIGAPTQQTEAASASESEPASSPPEQPPQPTGNTKPGSSASTTRHTSDQQKVLDAFDYTPLALDTIVEATGFDIVTVTNLAFDLELSGAIVAAAGGKYVKSQ